MNRKMDSRFRGNDKCSKGFFRAVIPAKAGIHLLKKFAALIFLLPLLSSCKVGPNYVRPSVEVPAKYKEAHNNTWKVAKPNDMCDRGEWWRVFNDPDLNALEEQVQISNQNIAAAVAQYMQALALVKQARSNLFPQITATASLTREKQSALTPFNASPSSSTLPAGAQNLLNNDYLIGTNATWAIDIWGTIRRQIEQSRATAQATAAQLAAVTLSAQATLAQNYFQLRALDVDQKILDDTVIANRRSLQLTKLGFSAGTTAAADVASAETQLKTVEAQAIDNGVNRAIFEHAIAVLIGKPASTFSIKPKVLKLVPPTIPVEVPSELLERRPDIAQAERNVAAANAGVGVAIGAYFPALSLTGSYGYETFGTIRDLFTQPMLFWSIGPALTQTVFDGGFRQAQVAAARATYQQTVAQYRQTVLAAFQNVEDNLSTLRILAHESPAAFQASKAADRSLQYQILSYQSGTVTYTNVIVAQTNALNAKKTYADIAGRQMVAAVGLITALGGGWDAAEIYLPTPVPNTVSVNEYNLPMPKECLKQGVCVEGQTDCCVKN